MACNVTVASARQHSLTEEPGALPLATACVGSDGSPACRCPEDLCPCPCREALHRRLRGPVTRFLACRLVNAADAEDLAQEVFLKCFAAVKCEGSQCPFPRLLFRAAKNAAADYNDLTRHRNLTLEEVGPDLQTPSQSPEGIAIQRVAVREALGRLPAQDREVLVMHCVQSFSATEIGERLNMSLDSVKKRLQRAKQRLRSLLVEAGFCDSAASTARGGGDMQQAQNEECVLREESARELECRWVRQMIDVGELEAAALQHLDTCHACGAYRRENGKLRELVREGFACLEERS